MKKKERLRGLIRSPKLLWDILVRGKYNFTYDLMPVKIYHMSTAKRLNLLKAGSLFIYRRLKPLNWPLHMQIELTNYCNLSCPVCPIGIREMRRVPKAMDVSMFEHLMDELGPYLLTASLWAWGEPLLHPRLEEILRIIQKHPIVTLLSTNGQNLYENAVINTLITAPPTYLIVAIDGLTDDTHSKFRVGAKLDPILFGVRRLAEIKQKERLEFPILHMRYMVMKHNEHEIPRLKNFAQENGFDLLTLRTLSIIDSSSNEHQAFVPEAKELRAYDYEGQNRIRRGDFICQQPFWFPTVFADGTVVACEQDYNAQLSFGKLSMHMSFANLWFSSQSKTIRRMIRDASESLSFCKNCPYTDRWAGACSIRAFNLNRKPCPSS
jgi:radical SAM protein with 4Fe4S-binding SPASM domain